MSASTDALVGSASTTGRAAVNAQLAASKTAACAATAAFLVAVAADDAAVATAGVANVTVEDCSFHGDIHY